MTRHFTAFILLLFLGLAARAGYEFNPRCLKANDLIFGLRMKQAKQLLAAEKSANPGNLIPVLLEDYIDFFSLFLSENGNEFDLSKADKEERLKILDKDHSASPFRLYCQAKVYLNRSMLRMKYGETIGAAQDLNKAYRLLKQNHTLFPDFLPNDVELGWIHALFGSVPEGMNWIKRLLDLEGTLDQARTELQSCVAKSWNSDTYEYVREESMILLIILNLNQVHDKKAREIFFSGLEKRNVPEMARNRPVLAYVLSMLQLKAGKNDEALKILISFPRNSDQLPFYYLDYLSGICLLNKMDTTAASYFRYFLSRYKGQNYVKTAWQHLAWIELLKGNREGYFRKMNSAKCFGKDRSEVDKQAQREAEGKIPPDPLLLQARLLFDGGYYQRSEEVLHQFSARMRAVSLHDSVEYIYRLGRVKHETGDIKNAELLYIQTIQKGNKQPWYYAANSALFLGEICESRQDYSHALQYYRSCQKMDFKDFRNGILIKAKEGINRVKR